MATSKIPSIFHPLDITFTPSSNVSSSSFQVTKSANGFTANFLFYFTEAKTNVKDLVLGQINGFPHNSSITLGCPCFNWSGRTMVGYIQITSTGEVRTDHNYGLSIPANTWVITTISLVF